MIEENSTFALALCRQCGEPQCVMNCQAEALSKDMDTASIGGEQIRRLAGV